MKDLRRYLGISKKEQYRTAHELREHSNPDVAYYLLLILSTLIIVSGLLLGNTPIVIGGMLVTPLLTPILVISLGIAMGDVVLIFNTGKFVVASIIYIIIAGFVMALLFGEPNNVVFLEDTLRGGMLYFIVALVSGIAGTFAWIRKDAGEILPGIAIAVSLVPPLALVGIGLGNFNTIIAVHYLIIFVLNFFGIVTGSLMVFSLSKFNTIGESSSHHNSITSREI